MNKLSRRLELLENRQVAPAAIAAAAREFENELRAIAERMPQSHENIPVEQQLERWSPAQRAAWRMRFVGEPMAEAIAAVGFLTPANPAHAALLHIDHLDVKL